jgi:hypothetical protein
MKGRKVKRSRINPVSEKRRRLNVSRRIFVKDILEARPECEAKINGICGHWATDVHEILTRARGGSILDPENVLALCRMCHTYITDNPAFSQEHGFTVHSWATSADLIAAQRAREMYGY